MTLNSMLSSRNIYVVDGKRTPFGRFGGSLKERIPCRLSRSCF